MVRKFPERLRRLRLEKGWQQKDLSERSGVRRNQLTAYEIGKYRPSWEALIQLSDAIDCSVDFLMRGEESSSPRRQPESAVFVNGS